MKIIKQAGEPAWKAKERTGQPTMHLSTGERTLGKLANDKIRGQEHRGPKQSQGPGR